MTSLNDLDWVMSIRGNVLHRAILTPQDDAELTETGSLPGWVGAACGRELGWVMVPGVGSRMGVPRCRRCCDALGYPHGNGSPKNDPACRVLLGLDVAP